MSEFLTPEEVADLTGAKMPSIQAEVLRDMGLNVWPNRQNKVKVSREALIRCQIGMRETVQREPVVRLVVGKGR